MRSGPSFVDRSLLSWQTLIRLRVMAFANRHEVGNTTLVLLDAEGKRLETLVGIQEEGALRQRIRATFGL